MKQVARSTFPDGRTNEVWLMEKHERWPGWDYPVGHAGYWEGTQRMHSLIGTTYEDFTAWVENQRSAGATVTLWKDD